MLLSFLGRRLVLHDTDTGGGDGGGGNEEPKRERGSDVHTRYNGDAVRMSERLAERENDNYSLREKNRELKRQLDEARGKAPAEGAVILTGDDAKAWEELRTLGSPAELKKAREERDALSTENQTYKRNQQVQDAAEAYGYKPTVLRKLPSLAGKDIVIKDVEVEEDGAKKMVKRAFVKDGDKETALPDYVQSNDPEFVEALGAQQNQQNQKQQGGTGFVRQAGSGAKPTGKANVAQDHISKMYSLPKRETK